LNSVLGTKIVTTNNIEISPGGDIATMTIIVQQQEEGADRHVGAAAAAAAEQRVNNISCCCSWLFFKTTQCSSRSSDSSENGECYKMEAFVKRPRQSGAKKKAVIGIKLPSWPPTFRKATLNRGRRFSKRLGDMRSK
jgi:hypothetical protein